MPSTGGCEHGRADRPGAREHEPTLEFSEDLPETPDKHGVYPRLDDAQIAALSALGQRRATQPGDILFREGDRNCDFFVVVAGKVTAIEEQTCCKPALT